MNPFSYPAYVTSAGWLGYSDEKVARLTKEAVAAGFNHFKMKVGADQASDLRRGKIIRSIIDDPQYLPANATPIDPESEQIKGKNAGPTGAVLMIDANQVWDVNQAIDYVKGLADIKPWYGSIMWSIDACLLISSRTGSLKSPLRLMTSSDTPLSARR